MGCTPSSSKRTTVTLNVNPDQQITMLKVKDKNKQADEMPKKPASIDPVSTGQASGQKQDMTTSASDKTEQTQEAIEGIYTYMAAMKAEKVWTDENGIYKQSVLKHLTRITHSYDDIEKFSPSVEACEKDRREIATQLVKDGLIQRVCLHILNITKREWDTNKPLDAFLLSCLRTIQNFTDASEEVVNAVVIATGFLEHLHDILKSYSEDFVRETLKKYLRRLVNYTLDIVHNCSQHESALLRLRSLGFVDVLEPYLKTDDDEYKLVTLGALASMIDENQSQIIADNERPVRVLVYVLLNALENQKRRYNGYSARECALIVRHLARNDANKKLLVDAQVLGPLVKMIEIGSDQEILEAVRALRVLAFDESNQERMVTDTSLGIIDILISLKTTPTGTTPPSDKDDKYRIKEEATRTLWNMRKKILLRDKYKAIGQELSTQTGSESSRNDVTSHGHVMISYQWGHQTDVKNIYRRLCDSGLKVWFDIESMEGSTLQAMAEAVERAEVVVIFMTRKYKDSPNCRAEAEYAFEKRKKIVPCVMEAGYRPDGWLGLIVGSKLRFDFSGKYPFEQKLEGLIREIQKHFEKDGEAPSIVPMVPVQEQAIAPDVVDSLMTAAAPTNQPQAMPSEDKLTKIRQWKQADVHNWILKERLSKDHFGSLSGEDIALLSLMQIQAPESFYNLLQTMLQIKELSVLSRLTWALRDLLR